MPFLGPLAEAEALNTAAMALSCLAACCGVASCVSGSPTDDEPGNGTAQGMACDQTQGCTKQDVQQTGLDSG